MVLVDGYVYFIRAQRLVLQVLSSFYRKLIGTPYQPMVVYKVIKFKTVPDDNEIDVTNTFLNGERIALSADEVLEFRVQWLGRKYRFVSTNANTYPSVSHCMSDPRMDQMIVKAVLLNATEGLYEDVLERVKKFNGPAYDRFGESIRMKWMFIHDDLEPSTKLMVITRTGNIFSFGPNDVFDLKK